MKTIILSKKNSLVSFIVKNYLDIEIRREGNSGPLSYSFLELSKIDVFRPYYSNTWIGEEACRYCNPIIISNKILLDLFGHNDYMIYMITDTHRSCVSIYRYDNKLYKYNLKIID